MSSGPAAQRRLGTPALAPVVDELARRFAEGAPVTRITVRDLTIAQREALADLFASDRLPPARASVNLARLVAILGLAEVDDLRMAVEGLRGPLGDRRRERAASRAACAAFWEWVDDEIGRLPMAAGSGGAVGAGRWLDALRRGGIRGGIDAYRRRLAQAFAVLTVLPSKEEVTLASFADDRLGNPHAIDRGTAIEGLVLEGLAHLLDQDRPRDAESARQLWERAGVAPDPLSSTVTVVGLGLGVGGGDPLAAWLRSSAESGEAAVLTLAQLRRWPVPPLGAAEVAYVVENPSLLAEAVATHWSGPPIICSSGRPTVAVVTLIRQLVARGARCHQHADFDAAGLAITAWLGERAGTIPWQMTAASYRQAARAERSRIPLVLPLPATPWDPELGPTMASFGVAVYEEELRAGLLATMSA